eukprot:2736725-Amphidinium_carterae.3
MNEHCQDLPPMVNRGIVEGNSTARERATAYHQAFALSVSNLKRRYDIVLVISIKSLSVDDPN